MQMGYLFIDAIQDFFGLIHKLHMTLKKGHFQKPNKLKKHTISNVLHTIFPVDKSSISIGDV